MPNNVNCKEMRFVIRNLVDVDFSSPLFKDENFVLRSASNRGKTIHNDNNSKQDLIQKNRPGRKTMNGKREANKTANFCDVGERKTRGKWKIM